jgi:hypothetical protein
VGRESRAASPSTSPLEVSLRSHPVLFAAALLTSSCSSSATDSTPTPDPDVSTTAIPGCYGVVLGGTPAADVSLPTLIQLTRDPAPSFVEPGHLAVKEPGVSEPRAPFSWWTPVSDGTLELVLGGGYTGYSFSLRSAGRGRWSGKGKYFADIGVEPTPGPLPVRLTRRSCP